MTFGSASNRRTQNAWLRTTRRAPSRSLSSGSKEPADRGRDAQQREVVRRHQPALDALRRLAAAEEQRRRAFRGRAGELAGLEQVAIVEIGQLRHRDRAPLRFCAMRDHAPQAVRLRDARRPAQNQSIHEAERDRVDAQTERQDRDHAEREARRAQEAAGHRTGAGR